jgi:hypothetical protein
MEVLQISIIKHSMGEHLMKTKEMVSREISNSLTISGIIRNILLKTFILPGVKKRKDTGQRGQIDIKLPSE